MPNNFQITQGSGTFMASNQAGSGEHYQRVKLVDSTEDSTTPIGTVSNPLPVTGSIAVSNFPIFGTIANLCLSVTAASGSGITATLPAVSGEYHVITAIEIVKYNTANSASSATPNLITTTNLPGSLTFTWDTVGNGGQALKQFYSDLNLKSSVSNTITTITAPASSNTIWRLNIFYYTAA